MTRSVGTGRWLVTLLIAVWLPLCCCQANGVIRAGLAAVGGEAGEAGEGCCGCCCDGGCGEKGEREDRRSCNSHDCCGLLVKAPPRGDRWTPDLDVVGVALLAPAVVWDAPAMGGAERVGRWDEDGVGRGARTLVRLRCALNL